MKVWNIFLQFIDLRLDWSTYRVFKNDRKLLDLATIFGEAFPLDASLQDLDLQQKLLRLGPFGGRTRTQLKKQKHKKGRKQAGKQAGYIKESNAFGSCALNEATVLQVASSDSEEEHDAEEGVVESALKSVRVHENDRPDIIRLYLKKHEGESCSGGIPFSIHPEQVVCFLMTNLNSSGKILAHIAICKSPLRRMEMSIDFSM